MSNQDNIQENKKKNSYNPSGEYRANGKSDFEKQNKHDQLIALSQAAYGAGLNKLAQATKDLEEIQQNPTKYLSQPDKLFEAVIKVELANEQIKTFKERFKSDFGKEI